ncbi:PAS domain-containing sensor histidine kinase [Polaribacter reichenbachii]|uniref:histidine kinase n=1 Tax=Polaribacter reichenbachii TaxID=996801 RepID=A0A1B8TV43_9FLAO|nr:PAS domain-containing sensor histidine kinase [Polaribacter reichenbachii]APZ45468.1 PAS domain-containing sensor histidine kinase [Polaribacter reichenbachii]AUC19329.1 PAS domain-containing sensor histidine kinase [Polaribacter reichenbachii]OBY63517.1 PAS domain-containing sensor histidine kinase [Polaribacter reichenbachii]
MFKKDQDIFNILLGSVSEGVIIVDEHQNIVEANESAIKMFGYNNDELIKKPLNILIPQNYHANHGSHFKGFMKDKKKRRMGQGRDIFGAKKDGSIFPLEAGLNPFNIYGQNYVMALIIDITFRKEQEKKIIALNTKLENEVEQRTEELKAAIEELKSLNLELGNENQKRKNAEEEIKSALKKEQELNELKTKFLSLVSHEFKTPLSGILTSTMLLGKYKLSEQQKNRDKHLKTITDKVHYLNNILNDFLSVEKLERGQIHYNPTTFKLSKVLDEVVYNANILLKDGQKINYPVNINNYFLHQDEKIIELALSNLVNNAIKYSSENTIIDLNVYQNETETTFTVNDNGIGIPKNDQKNIFNRYFRAENALLSQGTGIGLNIVKTHIENLNGTISFKSTENIGTTFTIIIPNKSK